MKADCGACSFCCFVMAVPDISKPACVHCEHEERPHGGCRVYDKPEKPQACTDFACLWLVSQSRRREERMIPALRPDRSKVMLHDARDGQDTVYLHVDPAHPDAWRWEPIQSHIDMIRSRGCAVHIIIGRRRIILDDEGTTSRDEDGSAARTALRAIG